MSGATVVSNGIKKAVYSAVTTAYNDQNPVVEDEYTYGYVGLSWAEYWANEGVYAAGNDSTSDAEDSRGESDKGGFDVVTRATANHGLHRGNFQCIVEIETESGKAIGMDHWTSKSTFVTTDGEEVTFSKGTITHADGTTDTMTGYEILGTKYVPVAVKTSDLEALKDAGYTFVENGSELAGGYSENNLSSYTATADVDADTYGLKTATLNEDGKTFSFSARSITGTDSGLKDEALKTAEDIDVTVKEASGSYGEFLRVDLTGDGYGALGAAMQSVTWTYYGDDSTYSNALQSYGTKFAADNWMHKSFGIQLGLTDSVRCQLPEGTDGTGYWTVTVHALGYQDYTAQIEVTDANIVNESARVTDATKTKLQDLYDQAAALDESDYTDGSWSTLVTERDETKDLLKKSYLTEATAKEQITHLQGAIDDLVKATYVYMNITYAEFYAAELENNDVIVDVFTSATKTKTRTGTLSGGSYHADSTGSEILGIVYGVKLGDDLTLDDLKKLGGTEITDDSSITIETTNRGKTSTTTYTGKDALYEAPTFSYYVASEKPSNYKVATKVESNLYVLAFSEVKGAAATTLDAVSADFTTETGYGDYQLDLNESIKTSMFGESGSGTVYGVVVHTTDEDGEAQSYGMRHLENIWRTTELAWCTGFTTEVHGCPTDSDHYESMMGNTITSVTYYTSNGVFEIPLAEATYVPVKFDTSDFAVADAQKGDASTSVTVPAALPSDYEAVYTLGDAEVVLNADGTLDVSALEIGSYTLTVSDKGGTYASFSTTFEVKEDAAVKYDAGTKAIVAEDGAAEGTLAAYLGKIQSVSVDGTSYSATGRGAKTIVSKDDGTLAVDGDVLSALTYGNHTIVVKATGYNDITIDYVVDSGYVLMNIPYDKFYAAETGSNTEEVDGFTSATKNKTRTSGLAGGSYHVDPEGTDITGITYAVKVNGVTPEQLEKLGATVITDESSVDITVTNRGNTSTSTFTGKDALFEASSYSYYVLADEPTSYKELTLDQNGDPSFGTATGTVKTVEGVSAEFSTESNYGDYQLDMDDSIKTTMFGEDGSGTVYGVVVNTKEGYGYGMRHVENIWRTTEIAWCTGFTTQVHGCPTSSDHYKSMMGKTIDSVTYYTSNGIYTFDIDDTYVPIKIGAGEVDDAQVTDDSTTVTLPELPSDFKAKYTIEGWLDTVKFVDSLTRAASTKQLVIPDGQPAGAYTLVVTDESGKYASFSMDFELKTDAAVEYDATKVALVAKEGAAEDALKAYTEAITSVSVDGTSYSATGRKPTVIINEDGTLNVTGDVLSALANGEYKIVVTATGYNDVEFAYTKQADKTALAAAIASAQKLVEGDYTAASWADADMAAAIASAQDVYNNAAASDDDVANAITALANAQAKLAKKASDSSIKDLGAEADKSSSLVESSYTVSSWANYQKALAAAKAVLASDDASEDEVNAALANLEDARNALVKTNTQQSNTSSTTNTTNVTNVTNVTNETNKKSVPQTGDESATGIAGVVAGIGAALVAAAVAVRRRFTE